LLQHSVSVYVQKDPQAACHKPQHCDDMILRRLNSTRATRIPCPEARVIQKVVINQFLNLLDDELEGKEYLCGDGFSAADIHFYGLMKMMVMQVAEWVLSPGRKNVAAYFKRMDGRKASQDALAPFGIEVSL